MYLFLLISLCMTLCWGQDEDWTDPTDMFNYDAATGKMIKLKHNPKENTEAVCEKQEDNAWVKDREKTKQVIEEYKKNLKSPESSSNPVFRRYLRKLLNEAERFGLPEDSNSEVYYSAEMVLTKQMVVEIQKFIDDEDWNLGALEDSLIRTLVQFRFHNVKEWWTGMFEDYFGIDLITTIKILVCILCVVSIMATEFWSRIGWFTQLKRLIIISFMVSLVWNWLYLYKVAFAERQAELAKLHKFDGTCGEKISWSESLLEWWKGASTFQNDPCEEYYKLLMINPALMVPPTKALALTFTDFITEPLKHIGKALGEFLNGLLVEIPVFYQLLVLILIAVILMVSCYGASTTIGQVLIHRNHREANQQQLPPAEPQRLPYGNYIEGRRQQQNLRLESLQAMDTSDGRNNMHLQGHADGDFPLSFESHGQEWRWKKRSKKQKSKTIHLSYEMQVKDQKVSCSPQQRKNKRIVARSSGPHQRKEDQKVANPIKSLRNEEPTQMTDNLHKSEIEPLNDKSFSQEEVEPGVQHSDVEPLPEDIPAAHPWTETGVEEISPGEQPCQEIHPHDKSLEQNGGVCR
ncbi:chloride channel CLIC-like protein 1 [Engystomops pustulosus]|uniref:chloride channel CLIC-like protein 1 n=1 Tax=Engystomops pustulosus TaxID=76066 RepID=UPI003AFAFD75